jgi:hypothetical protein
MSLSPLCCVSRSLWPLCCQDALSCCSLASYLEHGITNDTGVRNKKGTKHAGPTTERGTKHAARQTRPVPIIQHAQ